MASIHPAQRGAVGEAIPQKSLFGKIIIREWDVEMSDQERYYWLRSTRNPDIYLNYKESDWRDLPVDVRQDLLLLFARSPLDLNEWVGRWRCSQCGRIRFMDSNLRKDPDSSCLFCSGESRIENHRCFSSVSTSRPEIDNAFSMASNSARSALVMDKYMARDSINTFSSPLKCPKYGAEAWLNIDGEYECQRVKCGHRFKPGNVNPLDSVFSAAVHERQRLALLPVEDPAPGTLCEICKEIEGGFDGYGTIAGAAARCYDCERAVCHRHLSICQKCTEKFCIFCEEDHKCSKSYSAAVHEKQRGAAKPRAVRDGPVYYGLHISNDYLVERKSGAGRVALEWASTIDSFEALGQIDDYFRTFAEAEKAYHRFMLERPDARHEDACSATIFVHFNDVDYHAFLCEKAWCRRENGTFYIHDVTDHLRVDETRERAESIGVEFRAAVHKAQEKAARPSRKRLSGRGCYNCQAPAVYEFEIGHTLYNSCSHKCNIAIADMAFYHIDMEIKSVGRCYMCGKPAHWNYNFTHTNYNACSKDCYMVIAESVFENEVEAEDSYSAAVHKAQKDATTPMPSQWPDPSALETVLLTCATCNEYTEDMCVRCGEPICKVHTFFCDRCENMLCPTCFKEFDRYCHVCHEWLCDDCMADDMKRHTAAAGQNMYDAPGKRAAGYSAAIHSAQRDAARPVELPAEGAHGWAWVRPDLLRDYHGAEVEGLGPAGYEGRMPLQCRWADETENDEGVFQVFYEGDWRAAESIDWEFTEPDEKEYRAAIHPAQRSAADPIDVHFFVVPKLRQQHAIWYMGYTNYRMALVHDAHTGRNVVVNLVSEHDPAEYKGQYIHTPKDLEKLSVFDDDKLGSLTFDSDFRWLFEPRFGFEDLHLNQIIPDDPIYYYDDALEFAKKYLSHSPEARDSYSAVHPRQRTAAAVSDRALVATMKRIYSPRSGVMRWHAKKFYNIGEAIKAIILSIDAWNRFSTKELADTLMTAISGDVEICPAKEYSVAMYMKGNDEIIEKIENILKPDEFDFVDDKYVSVNASLKIPAHLIGSYRFWWD